MFYVSTIILQLKPGDVLLVNACGSSIGRIFAQLSNILGFRLIAVVRNNNYTKELFQLGASYVINTSEESLHNIVKELTNGIGVTSAIDSIGGVDRTELASCVKLKSILLSLGLLSGTPVNQQEISHRTNVNVKLFHLRHWNNQVSIQVWHETFNQLIKLINDKKLKLMKTNSYYNLMDVKEAVGVAESTKGNKGKAFLQVNDAIFL